MRNVLVTGGDGYLGGRIVRALAQQGFAPVAGCRARPESSEYPTVVLDLQSAESLEAACQGMDAIVHLAALNEIQSAADPVAALDITTGGTVRLCAAARKAGVQRILYLSTAHVYGAPLQGRITEDRTTRPAHPYSTTHRAAEDTVLAGDAPLGLVVRLSNGIGAPASAAIDRWTLVGNDLCRQAVTQRKLVLNSSGLAKRNFIPLGDVCRAVGFLLSLPAESRGEGLFNLGGPYTLSILEIAQRIAERCEALYDFKPPIERPEPRQGETYPELDYRSDRLEALGFRWETTLDQELDATLEFCRNAFTLAPKTAISISDAAPKHRETTEPVGRFRPTRRTSEHWAGRKVLVTGASGLLGRWLVRELMHAEAQVTVLARDTPWADLEPGTTSPATRAGDILNREEVRSAVMASKPETVFHLAAQSIVSEADEQPFGTLEINVAGTWNVLEACRESAVGAAVLSSSESVYGAQPRLPIQETSALLGHRAYAVSKRCAEIVGRMYAQDYGVPVGLARCANLFGPGDLNWSRSVPGAVRAVLTGTPFALRSHGTALRGFLYVRDAAIAYMALAEQLAARPELAGEAFNLAGPSPVALQDLIGTIFRMSGHPEHPIDRSASTATAEHHYMDGSKARDTLGWTPEFTLEEGLAETIGWYREYFADRLLPSGGAH